RHPEWQGSFLRIAATTPAGPLTEETYETIVGEILAYLREGDWDAVYLALHGAMLADHAPAADLETLRRVRTALGGDVLLGASFDLHANLGEETCDLLDM